MIAGPPETMPGRERLRGFQRAVAALDLPYFDDLVAYGDYYYDSGRAAMERLLAAGAPPTAVFAASDMMAIGAIRAIHAAGLSVPQDVAVVGFDDIAMAAMAHPPLTTIRQEKAALGALAAETLLRNVAGAADDDAAAAPATVTLPVSLVVRDSTAPGTNADGE